jgi:hypothetical protein
MKHLKQTRDLFYSTFDAGPPIFQFTPETIKCDYLFKMYRRSLDDSVQCIPRSISKTFQSPIKRGSSTSSSSQSRSSLDGSWPTAKTTTPSSFNVRGSSSSSNCNGNSLEVSPPRARSSSDLTTPPYAQTSQSPDHSTENQRVKPSLSLPILSQRSEEYQVTLSESQASLSPLLGFNGDSASGCSARRLSSLRKSARATPPTRHSLGGSSTQNSSSSHSSTMTRGGRRPYNPLPLYPSCPPLR